MAEKSEKVKTRVEALGERRDDLVCLYKLILGDYRKLTPVEKSSVDLIENMIACIDFQLRR